MRTYSPERPPDDRQPDPAGTRRTPRRAHRLRRAVTVISVILRAASALLLVPLLGALFSATPSDALPWLGALTAATVGRMDRRYDPGAHRLPHRLRAGQRHPAQDGRPAHRRPAGLVHHRQHRDGAAGHRGQRSGSGVLRREPADTVPRRGAAARGDHRRPVLRLLATGSGSGNHTAVATGRAAGQPADRPGRRRRRWSRAQRADRTHPGVRAYAAGAAGKPAGDGRAQPDR